MARHEPSSKFKAQSSRKAPKAGNPMARLDFSHLQKLLLSTGLQPSETFFHRLAERDNDGSRGLKPTVRGQAYHPASRERRLNGQTRRWRSTVAPRRVTTILPFRGLKSTATFMASLREAKPAVPSPQKVMRPMTVRSLSFTDFGVTVHCRYGFPEGEQTLQRDGR